MGDNFKMNLNEIEYENVTGFIWLSVQNIGELLWTWSETWGLIKEVNFFTA
jgi:hypothetical protein